MCDLTTGKVSSISVLWRDSCDFTTDNLVLNLSCSGIHVTWQRIVMYQIALIEGFPWLNTWLFSTRSFLQSDSCHLTAGEFSTSFLPQRDSCDLNWYCNLHSTNCLCRGIQKSWQLLGLVPDLSSTGSHVTWQLALLFWRGIPVTWLLCNFSLRSLLQRECKWLYKL